MPLPRKLLTLFIGAVCWYHQSRTSGPGKNSVVYTMSTELPEPCVDRTSLSSNIEERHASRPLDEGRKNKLAPPIYSGDAAYCNIRSKNVAQALSKVEKDSSKKAKNAKTPPKFTTAFDALAATKEYDPVVGVWRDIVPADHPSSQQSPLEPTQHEPADFSAHRIASIPASLVGKTSAEDFHEVVKRQKLLLPSPVRAGPIRASAISTQLTTAASDWTEGQHPNPNNLKQRKFFVGIAQIACCSKTCLKNYVGVDVAQDFRWVAFLFNLIFHN